MALIGTRSGDDVGATAPRNLHSGTTVWSALLSEISESVKCYGPTSRDVDLVRSAGKHNAHPRRKRWLPRVVARGYHR